MVLNSLHTHTIAQMNECEELKQRGKTELHAASAHFVVHTHFMCIHHHVYRHFVHHI